MKVISEVLKTESVLQSARSLGVTPSAVSQNIKATEKLLGRPLFLRIGKRLKPMPLAIQIVGSAQVFLQEIVGHLEGNTGETLELCIGAPPVFGSTVLVDRLAGFRKRHPDVRVRLQLMDTHRLLEELREGRLECAFVDDGAHMRHHSELATSRYFQEELVLCCSERFFSTHLGTGSTLKALKTLPHIRYHARSEGVFKWYRHHYKWTPDVPYTLAIDSPHGVLRAVVNGWGLGVLPLNLIERAMQKRQIRVIAGPRGPLLSSVLIARLKERVPSRMERALLSALRES